jgi:hypothetical protein
MVGDMIVDGDRGREGKLYCWALGGFCCCSRSGLGAVGLAVIEAAKRAGEAA